MNIPLSIVLSLITAFGNAFGFYLLKVGENQLNAKSNEKMGLVKFVVSAIRVPTWLAGLIIIIIRIPLYVFALTIGLVTITQPLANTGIVFLVPLGAKYLKEKIGKVDIVAYCLLIAGLFTIMFSPEDLSYVAPPIAHGTVYAFMAVMVLLLAGCILLVLMKKKAIGLALFSGLSMGIAAVLIRLVSILVFQYTGSSINWFSLGSDMNLLLAVLSTGNKLWFASLVFYGAVVFILLYFVTVIPALRAGNLSYVIPLEMTTSFVLPVMVGFFILAEPANPILIVGICACFAGIMILSKIQAEMESNMSRASILPVPSAEPEAAPEADT
jgi:uncharacterized membrane protein